MGDNNFYKKLANIETMLRGIQEENIKYRRQMEDLLYNLDEDNFGADFKVKLNNKFSSIEQSAEQIGMTVGQLYNSPESTEKMPTNDGTFDPDKMYFYNDRYYYFNRISNEWKAVDENSVVSQFVMTKDGFVLRGDVLIDGNTFTNGRFETAYDDGSDRVVIADGRIYFLQKVGDEEITMLQIAPSVTGVSFGEENGLVNFFGEFDFTNAKSISGLYAVFA